MFGSLKCPNKLAIPVLCVTLQCLIISDAQNREPLQQYSTEQISALNTPQRQKLNSDHDQGYQKQPAPNLKIPQHGLQSELDAPNVQNESSTKQAVQEANTTPTETIDNEIFGHTLPRSLNIGALLRAFYVFVGLCAIVVMYIIVRTIRLRRKKTTIHKYGVLTNCEDVEIRPLGVDDEDEDTTLFDISNHPRP